jgi:hypothetical protein
VVDEETETRCTNSCRVGVSLFSFLTVRRMRRCSARAFSFLSRAAPVCTAPTHHASRHHRHHLHHGIFTALRSGFHCYIVFLGGTGGWTGKVQALSGGVWVSFDATPLVGFVGQVVRLGCGGYTLFTFTITYMVYDSCLHTSPSNAGCARGRPVMYV